MVISENNGDSPKRTSWQGGVEVNSLAQVLGAQSDCERGREATAALPPRQGTGLGWDGWMFFLRCSHLRLSLSWRKLLPEPSTRFLLNVCAEGPRRAWCLAYSGCSRERQCDAHVVYSTGRVCIPAIPFLSCVSWGELHGFSHCFLQNKMKTIQDTSLKCGFGSPPALVYLCDFFWAGCTGGKHQPRSQETWCLGLPSCELGGG